MTLLFSSLSAASPHQSHLKTVFGWLGRHLHWVVFGLILALAAFFRFWAAPLSSGPDIPQFWAFAKVFQEHGIDFYRYADASLPIFPYNGWEFVYPPVWLLFLGLALLAVPGSTATETFVDTGWRLAMKTPIIAADLAIGVLIYWAVPGSKIKKLIFACLWLFNPAAWYESAVFGQFDAIAAAFLIASLILLMKGKNIWAFLFAGLAAVTKQHVFISVLFMAIAAIRQAGLRRTLIGAAAAFGVVLVISVPFLVTGNFATYLHSIFLPGASPDYQSPLALPSAASERSSLICMTHSAGIRNHFYSRRYRW